MVFRNVEVGHIRRFAVGEIETRDATDALGGAVAIPRWVNPPEGKWLRVSAIYRTLTVEKFTSFSEICQDNLKLSSCQSEFHRVPFQVFAVPRQAELLGIDRVHPEVKVGRRGELLQEEPLEGHALRALL